MSKTTKWLVCFFGSLFQCDSAILESLHYAMPPTARDIFQRLPDQCSIFDLAGQLENIHGWRRTSNYGNDSHIFYPINSPHSRFPTAGQLEIHFGRTIYFWQHHVDDPKRFICLTFNQAGQFDQVYHRTGFNLFDSLELAENQKLIFARHSKSLRDLLLFADYQLSNVSK